MKLIILVTAALFAIITCGLLLVAPASAAETVIAPSSVWFDIWQILQPIIVLLVSTVGPIFVAWISARLIAVLKVTDEKKQLEIEAQLRDALHASALNALKYAVAKSGIGTALMPAAITETMIANAANYVQDKNPDALAKLGVRTDALRDIIISKVPDVLGAAPKMRTGV